ncbi:MAG: rubrerythrin family protein [Anaerolineales bacterium]|nr:MAG: rubrerythrin family protein [Anaerolineales bacterium]
MDITNEVREKLLRFQRNEITEYHIYSRLATTVESEANRRILEQIAADELRHYGVWKGYTGQDVAPSRFQVFKYVLISRLFGFTFGVKLMERGERGAQESYGDMADIIAESEAIAKEEGDHEDELLGMLDEQLLRYTGSIVLGLNDALVELTGALAGLTLALGDKQLVALTGSVTGIAAALSMGASEYLSTKSEESDQDPVRAALYTGTAYVIAVVLLILPYLLLDNLYVCLASTLVVAVLIIAAFNYYISVARDQPFRRRFAEMAGISLGVAGLSFGVGYLLRSVLGAEA